MAYVKHYAGCYSTHPCRVEDIQTDIRMYVHFRAIMMLFVSWNGAKASIAASMTCSDLSCSTRTRLSAQVLSGAPTARDTDSSGVISSLRSRQSRTEAVKREMTTNNIICVYIY